MNSSDGFQYINRSVERNILFLPGWAFDYRIFFYLDLPYNYIFPFNSYLKTNFFEDFIFFIKQNKIRSFSVLGWSMGGFFVADLLKKFGNTINIDSIYLLNIRSYFNENELDEKISGIKSDRINTLMEFYKFVFLGHRNEYLLFKEKLERNYLINFGDDELITGLNYLRNKTIDLSYVSNIKTIMIQGTFDKLAPPERRPKISKDTNMLCHVIKTGHLSFFSKEFKEILSNCHVKKP